MTMRLGFFTRVLDRAAPAARYELALEQIAHADRLGFDTAWVAQHHFHEMEGGLPAPLVFLAAAASRAPRIRLATGIITLPLEWALRVAEDTSVLDHLCGGRLEVGIGPGGNFSAFNAFGLSAQDRHALMSRNLATLRAAWRGETLPGGDRLYPANPSLAERLWQATFSVEGGRRAGADGDGVLLSRTQPRARGVSLDSLQLPIVDAYDEALPVGRPRRILVSRSVFVADRRDEARRWAEIGLRSARERRGETGGTLDEWIEDAHSMIGTPEDVIEQLAADRTVARGTELSVQVHSIDPPPELTLRSLELMARVVAPALGWSPATAAEREVQLA